MSPSTEPASAATTESSSAAAEARMPHAGEAVIALHARESAIASAAKCAMVSAGILPLKALRSKTFGRRAGRCVSAQALIAAAEALGAAAEVLSAEPFRHPAVGIGHA
jgi:hypothetical protein